MTQAAAQAVAHAASTMRTLLPADVAVVGMDGNSLLPPLFPEEEQHVHGASKQRCLEFTLGRSCARQALKQLGICPAPILADAGRGPIWPGSVVGSITHTASYGVAAVGRSSEFATIGIDMEIDAPLPEGVFELVTTPLERAYLTDERTKLATGTLIFCIKESVYKAWYPLQKSWLGFEDVTIHIDEASSTFIAMLPSGLASHGVRYERFNGRFARRDGMVLSAIAIPV